jgi:hypothetical protein
MRIVMEMSIARPIKAGKIGPKTAGNQIKASQPGLNNKRPSQPKPNSKGPSNGRPSSLTAAIRLGSRVIKGQVVTTRHRDVPTAAEAAAEAEVGAADVVDDFLHLCALGHEWRGLILNSE